MTKRRIMIIGLTSLVVFGILISAQILYQKEWLNAKLVQESLSIQGVVSTEIVTTKSGKEFHVVSGIIDDLSESSRQLEKLAAGIPIRMIDQRNDYLKQVFEQMQFSLQEGMITGGFTEMDKNLRALADNAGVKAEISMDSKHIYINLRQDQAQLVEILERQNDGKYLPSEGAGKS